MKKRTSALVSGLAATLVLAGCGGVEENGDGSPEPASLPEEIELRDDFDPNAHFTWGYSTATSTWDPHKSITGFEWNWLSPVYDRLIYMNPDGEIEPMLAESWEAGEDGLSMTLKLREGLTFSDGTKFDAEAVKINLDRTMSSESKIASEVEQMTGVEVIDEYSVKITVENGLGAMLGVLSARPGMMVSPTAIEAGTLDTQPVGIGPYTLSDFSPGNSADYEKTPDYWDPDAQRVASMTFRMMVDDQTRINALASGEIDAANLSAYQVKTAQDMDLQVIGRPTISYAYFMVNPSLEPFGDVKVREAVNYALDRVEIAEGLYEGYCTPQIQPWPESSFAYNEEIGDGLDVFPHDPEKAKELLAEAGYPDGFTMTTTTTNTTAYVQLSEVVQAQLAEVGIDMQLKPVPTPQVMEDFTIAQITEGNVNPYSGYADPHGVAARYFLPGGSTTLGVPASDETIQFAIDAAGPMDTEERSAIYDDMMQSWVDHPTNIMPICMLYASTAYGPNVSGVEAVQSGYHELRGVAVSPEA